MKLSDAVSQCRTYIETSHQKNIEAKDFVSLPRDVTFSKKQMAIQRTLINEIKQICTLPLGDAKQATAAVVAPAAAAPKAVVTVEAGNIFQQSKAVWSSPAPMPKADAKADDPTLFSEYGTTDRQVAIKAVVAKAFSDSCKLHGEDLFDANRATMNGNCDSTGFVKHDELNFSDRDLFMKAVRAGKGTNGHKQLYALAKTKAFELDIDATIKVFASPDATFFPQSKPSECNLM